MTKRGKVCCVDCGKPFEIKADNQVLGYLSVMRATQRELIRAGELEGPARGEFRWTDLMRAPAQTDEQVDREFFGTTAAIVEAAFLVDCTFNAMRGSVPNTLAKLRELRTQLDDTLAYVQGQSPSATRESLALCEGLRASGYAAGSQHPVNRFDITRANETVTNGIHFAKGLDQVIDSLAQFVPATVAAGFYEPGGPGSIGYFAVLLSERGLGSDEICEVLGEMPARESFKYLETWRRHRAAAVDNTKHFVNRAKRKLYPGDRRGTKAGSECVPLNVRACMLMRRDVDGRPVLAVRFGGRTDLQGACGYCTPVAATRSHTELAPGS